MSEIIPQPLLVICDLRALKGEFNHDDRLQRIVEQASAGLVGKMLEFGKPVEVQLPTLGPVRFWAAGQQKATQIGQETPLRIVDVLREPARYYVCQQCKEYGPL